MGAPAKATEGWFFARWSLVFCSSECVKGLRDDIALRFRKLPFGEGGWQWNRLRSGGVYGYMIINWGFKINMNRDELT